MLEEGTSKGSEKNRREGAEAIRRVVSGSQRREGFQKEGVGSDVEGSVEK